MSKVDKAEQRAFEAYPVLMCYNDFQMVEEDINKPLREIYQGGYHQAEKDLELGWEQIYSILYFEREVLREFGNEEHSNEEVCKEVLKRFKDFKDFKERKDGGKG